MQVEYYVKNVYGVDRIYIKDEKQAEAIRRITGRKTIEQDIIDAFKDLDLEFVEVVAPRNAS